MVNIPFLGALAGCSARRSERRVASHTSEEQRRNAPARAAKNGILAFSASLSNRSNGLETTVQTFSAPKIDSAHGATESRTSRRIEASCQAASRSSGSAKLGVRS